MCPKCIWRDYKGIRLHEQVTQGFFQENKKLIDWANSQPLANPLTCLGDGHDGIWNIITKIGNSSLGRFHLCEKFSIFRWSIRLIPAVTLGAWGWLAYLSITNNQAKFCPPYNEISEMSTVEESEVKARSQTFSFNGKKPINMLN
jgi:hypothetical protein